MDLEFWSGIGMALYVCLVCCVLVCVLAMVCELLSNGALKVKPTAPPPPPRKAEASSGRSSRRVSADMTQCRVSKSSKDGSRLYETVLDSPWFCDGIASVPATLLPDPTEQLIIARSDKARTAPAETARQPKGRKPKQRRRPK